MSALEAPADSPGDVPGAMDIEVLLEDGSWAGALPEIEALARTAAETALRTVRPPGRPLSATVLLADDATLQDLNRRFRDKNRPTNVLAFESGEAVQGPTGPLHLGDIAIAAETTFREAADYDRPLAHHVQHLVVHGVLHLVGYDHEAAAEAAVMESLEVEILARLGVADPYGEARS